MKLISILTLTFAVITGCSKTSTVYLVRHAEKIDNSRDPELSPAGKTRAFKLAALLENKNIHQIYSTNYLRTTHTAVPLAEKINVPVEIYAADTLPQFAKRLLATKENTLVIGHSNSTLSLMDAMGITHGIKSIEDHQYNNLFKITLKGKKPTVKLEKLTY